ncbi:FlgO family outer membrane protein [Desulfurivibrio dismutans]|uniref:FlgO family outer membrane protein n=1 Tax=Desulfurivibrio dismutans TaxID=1398908 RepID=UPI0023DA1E6D|nr:FlgO family outer membrane protein [Desulfurivibrio alkaliphilus]MDF1613973.1 FlgO family outer membrane protein [Desulfurivibrio alkaliphilus]
MSKNQTYGIQRRPGRVVGIRPAVGLLLILLAGLWLVPAQALAEWPVQPASAVAPAEPKTAAPAVSGQVVAALQIDETSRLYHHVASLSEQLFASLAEPDIEFGELRGGVIVLSFVDQRKLTRTTSFGRYLAEQLMNNLQQRRVPVVELRQSREVRIQEQRGEYGLSRNPGEIRETVQAAAMLTGTYTATAEQVIVNARIINNRNGVLLASATAIIRRTPVVDAMLSDPVSDVVIDPEPMYMKRLEF